MSAAAVGESAPRISTAYQNWHRFSRNPTAVIGSAIVVIVLAAALFAPLIAPYPDHVGAVVNFRARHLPPSARYWFGTDNVGRDIFTRVLFGYRISLLLAAVVLGVAVPLGATLGLIAGYFGGAVDGLIMRIADVQLTFPAILIALLIDGIVKSLFGNRLDSMATLVVLVVAIGLSFWVQYARTVRGSVMVEKNKDYVAAAQLIGLPAPVIMLRHVLPNAMGPILVIATINLALAIITEATLSFLGAGMPDTMPSLGTLIRIGNNYLFAGEWWIVAFPGVALAALILSINLLGDWLRDALNPKLR